MRIRVELPPGPLIEYTNFCNAIAFAVCPDIRPGLEGIDCIVGKLVKHHSFVAPLAKNEKWPFETGLQSTLLSEDGRPLDLAQALQRGVALELPLEGDASVGDEVGTALLPYEVAVPYALTVDDRRALKKILPRLPLLCYPIADDDAAAFLEAYRRLTKRPAWEPILITQADAERRRIERDIVFEQHQIRLQEDFAKGKLLAVDGHHVPVTTLAVGSLISREYATAYLERLPAVGGDSDAQREQRLTRPGLEDAPADMPLSSPGVRNERHASLNPNAPKNVAGNVVDDSSGADVEMIPRTQSAFSAGAKVMGKVARLRRVMELTGLGRSSIYNRMDPRSPQHDVTFPRSFQLGSTPTSAVGWDEEEIKAWVTAQAAADRTR